MLQKYNSFLQQTADSNLKKTNIFLVPQQVFGLSDSVRALGNIYIFSKGQKQATPNF